MNRNEEVKPSSEPNLRRIKVRKKTKPEHSLPENSAKTRRKRLRPVSYGR